MKKEKTSTCISDSYELHYISASELKFWEEISAFARSEIKSMRKEKPSGQKKENAINCLNFIIADIILYLCAKNFYRFNASIAEKPRRGRPPNSAKKKVKAKVKVKERAR